MHLPWLPELSHDDIQPHRLPGPRVSPEAGHVVYLLGCGVEQHFLTSLYAKPFASFLARGAAEGKPLEVACDINGIKQMVLRVPIKPRQPKTWECIGSDMKWPKQYGDSPNLKLTSPLKINSWKMLFFTFGMASFQGLLLFREWCTSQGGWVARLFPQGLGQCGCLATFGGARCTWTSSWDRHSYWDVLFRVLTYTLT